MISKKFVLQGKKYLKSKVLFNYKINPSSKYFSDTNSLIIARTFLSCIIVIFTFFLVPLLIDFNKNRVFFSKEFQNDSKKNFTNKLENKNIDLDQEVSEKDLFADVIELNELPSDTVRLSASTIDQLFKDTKYNLEDVRKKKLVKPVSLTLLPKEMRMIEDVKKRKDLFIQIILPLIVKENNLIRIDRKTLFGILNKSKNTKLEKKWLEKKFKQYGVANKDVITLKIRMDEIPNSIAIAQAAKETGWGTSRFAQEGNALFGQWTWSGEGIKPSGADKDETHKVMRFKVLQASVRAYQRNLNTHSSYKEFRSARAQLRDENKPLDSLALSEFLDKYAETGKNYVKILQQIINQNKLTDFDEAKLLPSSMDLESLI
mgnify:CR=1 FL=1|tara:strand:+ start:7961 stop:9082 length:1122 start_codon:yes stop_codon:yes gene_type:complete